MSAQIVRVFLQKCGIHCEHIPHPPALSLEQVARQLFIPLYQFARATLLRDAKGYLMAVLPVGKSIDFVALKQALSRDLELAWPEESAEVFGAMHIGAIPPLAPLYGVATLLDTSFADSERIFLPDGSGQGLLQVCRQDFMRLQASATQLSFTLENAPRAPMNTGKASVEVQKVQSRARMMREKVGNLQDLPPMPDVVAQLLRLSGDPETMPADVARVVATDPAISAQIMRYARSPWFAYSGQIESLDEAIYSVLGVDMANNIALGMAAGRVFTGKQQGRFGTDRVWRHAVYCATLAEGLAREVPAHMKLKPGGVYLSGLLHNVGMLILNHCFREEHAELEMLAQQQVEKPVWQLECKLYGMTHAGLGADLMRRWDLPPVVVRSIRHHHDASYTGQHRSEVLLILLANRLLKQHDIGDEASDEIPEALLRTLGLEREGVQRLCQNIMDCSTSLDTMIHHLAA